jgi:CBS domain
MAHSGLFGRARRMSAIGGKADMTLTRGRQPKWECDTVDQLMTEMTTRQFRHMPVVERGQLVGLVSIGDLVKIHVADAEFESGAMRQYIAPQPSLPFDQPSRLMFAGGA